MALGTGRNLAAEVTSDLKADERLIAVSWGRTGRQILTVYLWAAGLVVIAGGLYLILHQQWWLWAALAIMAVAVLATVVGPGATSRIPGYGVLLTDQQLILVRTSGSSPPRAREAPVSVPRGDVSVTSGHGFFGTTVLLTLTTPATGAPPRLDLRQPVRASGHGHLPVAGQRGGRHIAAPSTAGRPRPRR